MKQRMTFYKMLSAYLVIILFNACEKTDDISIDSANFTISSETIFLDEECTFEAEDTLGRQNYKWEFGDDTSLKGGPKVSHQYTKSGIYTATLMIDGKYLSKTIEVFPGRISYQIVNESDYYLPDILVYLDNYESGCTKRLDGIRPRSKTDIIYATSTHFARTAFNHSHIFGISIFLRNSEYTFYTNNISIKDFQHNIITITNTTKLTQRSRDGDDPEVYSLSEAGAIHLPEE